jgi:hypothetical protein
MRELCGDPAQHPLSYPPAFAAMRRMSQRTGLFVSGDLGVAVVRTLEDQDLPLGLPLIAPDGLSAACAQHADVADLVRLATSPEYAEARWQPASRLERQVPLSGSSFGTGS